MSCDHFRDDYELYALGALESEEAAALEEHLATGCAFCAAEVNRAFEQNEIVSRTVPLVDPPARLRRRLAGSLGTETRAARQFWPWLITVAAVLALAAGLIVERRARQTQNDLAQRQLASATRDAKILAILSAPGTKEVTFGGGTGAPRGAAYIHQRLGIVLVIGDLHAPPPGSKYESWIVPKTGAPQPVEPFQPDAQGHAATIVPGPVQVADIHALAVSVEPQNLEPKTPTKVLFAAPI